MADDALRVPANMAGFATVRELYSVEKSLLEAMGKMEARLTAKIEDTARIHETRHVAIDDFLKDQVLVTRFRAGQVAAMTLPLKVLEFLNRNRWLIALALAAAGLATGKIEVTPP